MTRITAKRKFSEHFREYACAGDHMTIKLAGGMFATARIHRDDHADRPDQRDDGFWPSQDPNAAGYIGKKSQRAYDRALAKAKATMKAWENDKWCYVGVSITIDKDDVALTGTFDCALWGIEMNYPKQGNRRVNSYLRDVANELLPDAIEAAKAKLAQLVMRSTGGRS